MSNPRLFIAVPVSDQVRDVLNNWASTHKKKQPFSKWTHPSDYHITLQFLGETAEQRIPDIISSLQQVKSDRFMLSIGRIGVFGPKGNPRILWASAENPENALKELQQQVSEHMAFLGYEQEKREFRAHITLARDYKGDSNFQLSELAELEGVLQWQVDRLELMSSQLGSTPMYRALHTFEL